MVPKVREDLASRSRRLRAQLVRVEAPGEGLGGDHVLRKGPEAVLVGDRERRRLVDRRALVLCVDLVERDRAEGDGRAVVLQPGDLDGLLELDPGAEYAGVVDLGRVSEGEGGNVWYTPAPSSAA